MMVSKFFILQELVPPGIFKDYGANAIWFLDERLLKLIDFTREYFDAPMTINTWHKGGPGKKFTERGFRVPLSPTGAYLSQHKAGRAVDYTIKGLKPDKVRQMIMDDEKAFMDAGLTTLEDGAFAPTWCHQDCRYTGLDHILIVRP